jgi:hypothetical protein
MPKARSSSDTFWLTLVNNVRYKMVSYHGSIFYLTFRTFVLDLGVMDCNQRKLGTTLKRNNCSLSLFSVVLENNNGSLTQLSAEELPLCRALPLHT